MQDWDPNFIFLVIESIIGGGKTAAAERIAKKTDWQPYYEPASLTRNPYFFDFYDVVTGKKDNEGEPYKMQVFFLSERYKDHVKIITTGGNAIQDRNIWGDCIFARMLHETRDKYGQRFIDERDFGAYLSLFNRMQQNLVQPTMVLYLDVDPKVALDRIKKRGKEFEKDITVEYLTELAAMYEEWLTWFGRHTPIHRLPYNDMPLNDQTIDEIIEIVLSYQKQREEDHFLGKYAHLIK